MAAGEINLLNPESSGSHELTRSEPAQVDQQNQLEERNLRGGRHKTHQQPRRQTRVHNNVNHDGIDQVMRQRESHRAGEPNSDREHRHHKTSRDTRVSEHHMSVAQSPILDSPSTLSLPTASSQIDTQTLVPTPPPSTTTPTTPLPSLATRNSVLPIAVQTINPDNASNAPQREQTSARPVSASTVRSDRLNNATTELEPIANEPPVPSSTEMGDFTEKDAQTVSGTGVSETMFVSHQTRDTDLFLFNESSPDFLPQLLENAESRFLELADEGLRQSGLAEWLSESESIQLDLAELDRLLDTLAQSDAGVAETDSHHSHRNVASVSYSMPGNSWAQSVGEMIILHPGGEVGPNGAAEPPAQITQTSAPWSAGIGLYRVFDFAGLDTKFDQAIADVPVRVDADSWNLLNGTSNHEPPATEISLSPFSQSTCSQSTYSQSTCSQSTMPSISTTTTLGFAAAAFGAHYLHRRYRRILLSKLQNSLPLKS
jgi:hypothetical protein